MANVKISGLPAHVGTLASGDLLPMVDVGTTTTETTTVGDVTTYVDNNISKVIGPSGNVANAAARFDGTTGGAIKGYTGTAPTFGDNGELQINNTDDSTSTTSGSVQVVGGVGISKNLYVGGDTVLSKLTTFVKTSHSTAFTASLGGKYDIIGASSFTVTLPSAATSNRRVEFLCVGSYTGIVTIDGSGAQTIDGALTYKMAANDYLLLESDGTNWRIIAKKGTVFVSADSNAGQALTANTTNLQYEDNVTDTHSAMSGSATFTAPRDGKYLVTAAFATTVSSTSSITIYKGGTAQNLSGMNRYNLANGTGILSAVISLSVGDTITIRSNGTETRNTTPSTNYLQISEL